MWLKFRPKYVSNKESFIVKLISFTGNFQQYYPQLAQQLLPNIRSMAVSVDCCWTFEEFALPIAFLLSGEILLNWNRSFKFIYDHFFTPFIMYLWVATWLVDYSLMIFFYYKHFSTLLTWTHANAFQHIIVNIMINFFVKILIAISTTSNINTVQIENLLW